MGHLVSADQVLTLALDDWKKFAAGLGLFPAADVSSSQEVPMGANSGGRAMVCIHLRGSF